MQQGSKAWVSLAVLCSSMTVTANQKNYLNDHWTATAEFVYMKRGHAHDRVLVNDPDKIRYCGQCSDFSVSTTYNIIGSMGYNPGYRVGLTYLPNYWMSMEGRFLSLISSSGTREVTGTALYYPFCDLNQTVDYRNASWARSTYTTHFWNTELNYWWHMTPRWVDYFSLSMIGGLRYFNEKELLKNRFSNQSTSSGSDFIVEGDNHSGAFQLGLNLQVNPTSYFSWELNAKVGFLETFAIVQDTIHDQNNQVILSQQDINGWSSGIMIDLSTLAMISFARHFDFHIGYEFLFLSGLATAESQLPPCALTQETSLRPRAGIYIYGLFAGLGVSF